MDRSEAIGNRLRLAREQAGLSQGQIAKMLDMHRPTISEIEAGRRKVSAEELADFARIYKVRIDWLVGVDDEKTNARNDRIELAARALSKMKPEDLDNLLQLLSTLRENDDED